MSDELEIIVSVDIDQNKSVTAINKSIKKLEKKIEKLKLQVAIDDKKSKSAITKEIEKLNKQKRQLYVDLKLRKDTLKKQYRELQKESNFTLNIDTAKAQREISQTTTAIQATRNETVTLANSLQKAFANMGLVVSAQMALQLVRKAANEASQAIKEYDQYATNLSIITGGSRESSNQLLGDLAEKSLNFKVDISDLESAEETLLRTGKTINETNKYLENTVYLSKLGFQDMDTSASQLVTIGNAYGYTADEMSAVVDKFVKLDSQANVTAGNLADGVAKSAQNAKLAGFNIDELSASIAGLKNITGSTESQIANSLNMIFSRLQNVKLGKYVIETEDGSENIKEALNDTEKILNTVNIKLRDSKNQFRDINDLFTELSDNWNKFNRVQQSAIATTVAGARQRNVFIALIENWNKIQELTDVSLNSMGTAVEKYDNYLQSIEAKSATFSTATKELWNNLLPTDFVGNMVDAGTAVVQFTDKYSVLNTILKSAVFYSLCKGLILAKDGFASMITSVKDVSAAMNLVTQSGAMTSQRMSDLRNITKVLTDSQLKLVLSNSNLSEAQMITILRTEGVSEAEAKAKLQALGLAQANQTATASTFSLSGSIKTLWSILEANPILVLTAAFTAFTTIQQKVQRENEEMQERAVETIKQYDEQAQSLEDLKQRYIDIVDSEDSTTKKTEELNKWKQTLIETYGLEKEAIEQVNLARENGLKLIDDEIIKDKIKGAETWLTDNKEAYKNAQKKLLGANNSAETAIIPKFNVVMNVDKNSLKNYSENFDDIMKQLTIKNPTKDNPLAQIKIQGSNVLQQYENLSKILNEITSIEVTKGLNKSEQELYDALLKKQKEYKKVVTDDMRDIVENGKKYTSMIQLYNFETDNGINFQNVSADTYKQFRNKFLQSLGYGYKKDSDSFSLDIEKTLLDMLPDLENSYRGIEITDIIDTTNADEIVNNISTVENAVEDLEKSLEKLSKSASSYVSNQKTVSNAFAEIEKYGQLSASTIQSLTEAGYAQALSVDSTTNAVTLNKSAVEKLNEQYREKIKLDGIQQKSELEEKFKEEQKAITDLSTEMRYANQERREAIMLEMQQHGLAMSDIAEQMAQIDALANSVYAPTFESGNNTDAWKEEAQSKIADVEHLYAMEQITYEEYINEIDKINQEYFANNKKYLDDYRKYEEKVYEGLKKIRTDSLNKDVSDYQHEITMGRKKEDSDYWDWYEKRVHEAFDGVKGCEDELRKCEEEIYKARKKLAEEAFNTEIDKLKEYADELSKTSINSNGKELNTQEKFREIANVYTDIQSAIQREINRIIQIGVEGNEEYLEELKKQLKEYADKVTDTFKSAVETEKKLLENQKSALSDVYDKEIDKIKKQQEDSKNAADAEIDLIQDKIDNLKKVNDEKQQEYDIEKAKQDLENKKQRTRMTYGSDGTIIYKQDDEKIKEAQQNLDKLLLEKQVNSLESQKSVLENMRDKESESYDKLIEDIESQKEQDERQFDILIQRLDDYLNPNSDTSNSDVWSEIAKMDGASYRNGKWVDKDGTEIDVTKLLAKADEIIDSNDKSNNNVKAGNNDTTGTDKFNKTLDKANEVIKNLKDKAKNSVSADDAVAQILHTLGLKTPDALGSLSSQFSYNNIIQRDLENITRNITSNKVINNSQPTTYNFGDINVNNPVGDVKKLANEIKNELYKEAMMQVPNDAMRIIYKK